MMSNCGNHEEIERKFILQRLPAGLAKVQSTPIEQGYLVHTDSREIRIRCKDRHWFLTIKDGTGLQRRETEIELTKQQAEPLWAMTLGRRITKNRYAYPYLEHTLEIDIFSGDLDPLRLCEIEFASVAAAQAFKVPGFLGADVTEAPEYKNANLALHGQPRDGKTKERYGCLPFLEKNNQLYVVLVTNQSRDKWIFPKGQLEPDMTPTEVALMESYEEAGLIGSIVSGLHAEFVREGGSIQHLYPLRVVQIADEWPEDAIRYRKVVKFKKAMKMLDDPAMVECAQALVAQL